MRVQPGTRAIAQRRRITGSIALLCFLEGLCFPLAQAAESISLVIENVRLLDLEQNTDDDVVVNVLVVDGRLEFVTPDAVAEDRVLTRIDARGGFLLGKLELGAPPSFVIVNSDPREDFQVLMDSGRYVQFAIEQGVIVSDKLSRVAEPDSEPEKAPEKKSGWLAYTPPPFALPLTYSNKKKWKKFETPYISGLFNPLPVAKSVNQGGWGAWEAAVRWSRVDLSEGEVEGGDMGIVSLGLNWWLTQVAQFSVNYRYITLDRMDEQGHSSGVTSRLLLILD